MIDNAEAGSTPAKKSSNGAQAAAGTLGQLNEQARQAGQQLAAHATDVAQDARARGVALVGEAKDRAASAAEDQKSDVAARLDDVAKAMHRSGEQMEGHQDWIAQLIERGADELGSLATTMRTNDFQGLLGKLGDLARRQPAVFTGAAMAAGFAAVRLGRVATAGASRADLPTMPEAFREPN